MASWGNHHKKRDFCCVLMVCSFIEGNGAFVEVCKVLGTSEKPGLHAGTRATSCDASWLRFDLGWKNSPADQLTKTRKGKR